jgi:hypothetical protein
VASNIANMLRIIVYPGAMTEAQTRSPLLEIAVTLLIPSLILSRRRLVFRQPASPAARSPEN